MPKRLIYAACGVLSVIIGAAGVVLPGVPTTFPLIVALWCFSRSFPQLEDRLVRIPLFRPYLRYIDRKEAMPLRARLGTLGVMWLFVLASCVWMTLAGAPWFAAAFTVLLALVGSWYVWGLGKAPTTEAEALSIHSDEAEFSANAVARPQIIVERSIEEPLVPVLASAEHPPLEQGVGA
ncbi:MAG: YbaN family protein [Planctomycetota bacterium]